MDKSRRHAWVPAALLVGLAYLIIGRVFALPGDHARLWRLAAWLASGVAFASHIGYEHFRLRHPPRLAALHAAVAVAIGAAALAFVGMIRSASTGSTIRPAWLLALILWPAITALPAFLVALVTTTALARIPRGAVSK